MANPAPGFLKNPERNIHFESSPRRVRVKFGDEWIADSTEMMLMYETGHLPVYYFPIKDTRTELLHPTSHSTHCPYKGEASYWTIKAGGKESENAVWGYKTPYDEMVKIDLQNYYSFYWSKMDQWFEEDEEIFVHPRDPHKRIDAVSSSRLVKIVLGGETIAESSKGIFLFETGLPTRYYLPRADVKMEFLSPTETATRCPYKGTATHWSAKIGQRTFSDIAWSYPEPIEECRKIKELICFYNENVDSIFIDGQKMETPETKWSK